MDVAFYVGVLLEKEKIRSSTSAPLQFFLSSKAATKSRQLKLNQATVELVINRTL